jgi:hypothetical protein
MLNRKQRRAAEHQARKQARKAQRAGLGAANQDQTSSPLWEAHSTPRPSCAVSLNARLQDQQEPVAAPEVTEAVEPQEEPTTSQAQIDANRANAQHSTGPTSNAGKAISSQNRRYHGLAGAFQIMSWEDPDAFATLRADLRTHYGPIDLIEQSYVDRLAEHMWLRNRCFDLQTGCFAVETEQDEENGSPVLDDLKQFAVLARYQKENERGMDKCVAVLEKFKAARKKEEIGFESECRKEEAHQARLRLSNARASRLEIDSKIRETLKAPMPGHIRIPFEELAGAFRGAIREVSEEIREEQAAA